MMQSTHWILVFTLSAAVALSSCGKKEDVSSDSTEDTYALTAETAVTTLGNLADEQSNSSFAALSQKPSFFADTLPQLLIPQAFASTCSRAFLQTCSNGVRTITYSACRAFGGLLSLTGDVTLTYSEANCAMSTNGDSVTRTYDFTVEGPHNGKLHIFSTSATDYRGTNISGGGELIKTSSDWEVLVWGRNVVLSKNDNTLMSHSVRTLSNIHVSGGLDRSSRVIDGGQLEVNHNLAEYTAVFVPSNLRYSSSCCHPVSGSLTVSYSGSVTGTGTLTFTGCGEGQLVQDGQSKTVSLSYCE